MQLDFTAEAKPTVKDYVSIHNHTIYSTLDGMCKLEPFVDRAIELGQKALGITDHGHSGGCLAFQRVCKKKGIKALLGAEIYTTPDMKTAALPVEERDALGIYDIIKDDNLRAAADWNIAERKRDLKTGDEYWKLVQDAGGGKEGVIKAFQKKEISAFKRINDKLFKQYVYDMHQFHLIVVAMNTKGWQNLCAIQSIASRDCQYNGRAMADLELLKKYNEGLLVSTACFEAGAKVFTMDGYKNIEDVSTDDLVLTHKGRFMPVTSTTSRIYDGEFATVQCRHMNNHLSCTADHKLFVLKKEEMAAYTKKEMYDKYVDKDQINKYRQMYKKCRKFQGEWVEACNLKKGDLLLFPFYAENHEAYFDASHVKTMGGKVGSKRRIKLKNYKVKIDEDFLWLLGMFAAEGNYNCPNNIHRIQFTLNRKEKLRIQKIESIIRELFGVEPDERMKDGQGIDITFNSVELENMMRSIFGEEGCLHKSVPAFVFSLPPEMQMHFLKGAWEGDGSEYFGKTCEYATYKLTYTTVSRALMLGMQRILINNHIPSSLHTSEYRVDKNGVPHQKSYYMYCYGDAAKAIGDFVYRTSPWKHPKITPKHIPVNVDGVDYMACEVTSVSLQKKDKKTVYCLNVEEDHSFTVDNIAVHNCVASRFSRLVQQKKLDEAEQELLAYKEVFGDRFYLELQPLTLPQQVITNAFYMQMHEKHGIPVIATSDVHYIMKDDWDDHDTFLCIAMGKLKDEAKNKELYIKTHKKDPQGKGWKPRMKYTNDYWLHSKEEMVECFLNQMEDSHYVYRNEEDPLDTDAYKQLFLEAIENTANFAARVNDDILIGSDVTLYPKVKNVPDGFTSDEWLMAEAMDGLNKYAKKMDKAGTPIDYEQYRQKVVDEMAVITTKHYSDYFLGVQEYINWANSTNPETGYPWCVTGPGRGSAAASLVLFLIGITHNIDPIKYDLMFSRFLTMDRNSPPDWKIAA